MFIKIKSIIIILYYISRWLVLYWPTFSCWSNSRIQSRSSPAAHVSAWMTMELNWTLHLHYIEQRTLYTKRSYLPNHYQKSEIRNLFIYAIYKLHCVFFNIYLQTYGSGRYLLRQLTLPLVQIPPQLWKKDRVRTTLWLIAVKICTQNDSIQIA